MKPKFSIAIPAYNRSDYLTEAVKSCLMQTAHDFEVIISDDCSMEDLGTVAKSFRDSRIRYSRSGERLGRAKNHQRAASLAEGDYVVNLNSDDLLLPEFLEIAGKALESRHEAAAVYSSMTFLAGSTISGFQAVPKIRFADRHVYLQNLWLEKNHGIAPTCCLFRRNSFHQIGGYRTFLKFAFDWDLYMRFMTLGGGVIFLPEVLAMYRKHEDQGSKTALREGLYDVLDLWKLDEYSHWPSWEIADVVIAELRNTGRTASGWIKICSQIRRRGLTRRLTIGAGKAICKRLWRRMQCRGVWRDGNYESPLNLDRAMRAANLLLGSLNR